MVCGVKPAFWKRSRQNELLIYFFSMGVPLFVFYLLYTLRARVQPNWIAPSVLPLLCLMAAYWDSRWREGARAVKTWLALGLYVTVACMWLVPDRRIESTVTHR